MDANDFILNLVDDDSHTVNQYVPSPKKGGRWTDRLKAKKAAKRVLKRKFPDQDNDTSHPPSNPDPTPIPKRPRIQRELPSDSTRPTKTKIISSLFTSNPVIAKHTNITPRPSKPSNAPVDTSTFQGLGLSPLIISHLSAKMSISQPTAIQQAALPTLLTPEERDAFIQSQTGSGKTLSFLLPIIQDLLPLSSLSYIDRSVGTLAVIIAPTRELAKQIYDVLEQLLQLRLRPRSDDPALPDPSFENSERLTRWLVPGLLTGGATKAHEKARLRKGVPIIVATPGRLLDHLQNTTSLDVGKCRWLVLDEADRLMELGFEETIQGILKSLTGRRRLAIQAEEEGNVPVAWEWRERRTILCSATIREDVQKLAGMALNNPVNIKALQSHPISTPNISRGEAESGINSEKFTPPSQLLQKYTTVPLKLRLVTLVALLRSLLSSSSKKHTGTKTKIIVFFSCTDSVDFHWSLLSRSKMKRQDDHDHDHDNLSKTDEEESDEESNSASGHVKAESAMLPKTDLYRLHGSLPLQSRLLSLKGFSSSKSKPKLKLKSNEDDDPDSSHSAVLFCTSVASRGLDLPFVRAVVQYDLPTEGGADEYVHRVGRTARVGEGGEAWAFVTPSEEKWVPWVEQHMGGNPGPVVLQPIAMSTVLESGFGGRGKDMEMRATQVQLSFERWVLQNAKNSELARRAYSSHMRAYSTHPSNEKHIFHIKQLHLGHLAKAFALRDAPNAAANANNNKSKSKSNKSRKNRRTNDKETNNHNNSNNAEERMSAVVRQQGRLTKKDGAFVAGDASEFQIATTNALETLARR